MKLRSLVEFKNWLPCLPNEFWMMIRNYLSTCNLPKNSFLRSLWKHFKNKSDFPSSQKSSAYPERSLKNLRHLLQFQGFYFLVFWSCLEFNVSLRFLITACPKIAVFRVSFRLLLLIVSRNLLKGLINSNSSENACWLRSWLNLTMCFADLSS